MNDADEIHVETNEGCAHSETQNKITEHSIQLNPREHPRPTTSPPPPGRMRLGVEAAAAFSMLTKFTRANGLRA